MKWVAALLAAVLALGLWACGEDGAEPGASQEATLVLDFQPNAVHAGIYSAVATGELADRGIELTIREPSASSDAPQLLGAGRADVAVMDIHDLGIARERGFDGVGVGALVQVPLAALIARDAATVERPADLAGSSIGVTGVPSDDAVLETVLEADGLGPDDVRTITIGFNSVPALAAGRVEAATAFWNAEGVELRRQGVETRELRVDDFGAPSYPELVLVVERETLEERADLVDDLVDALAAGTELVLRDPQQALEHLLDEVPALEADSQAMQLEALLEAEAFSPPLELDRGALEAWAEWDVEAGILEAKPDVDSAFGLDEPRGGYR